VQNEHIALPCCTSARPPRPRRCTIFSTPPASPRTSRRPCTGLFHNAKMNRVFRDYQRDDRARATAKRFKAPQALILAQIDAQATCRLSMYCTRLKNSSLLHTPIGLRRSKSLVTDDNNGGAAGFGSVTVMAAAEAALANNRPATSTRMRTIRRFRHARPDAPHDQGRCRIRTQIDFASQLHDRPEWANFIGQ
jgi:hypothetical protein